MQPMTEAETTISSTDIAIVGMAGRFPGARTIEEFWRNLRDGVESIRRMTDEELTAAGVPPEVLRDPDYVKASAVLDDMEMFDAPFFGFNPKEAAIMDPQHRLFLECAWEALESAGHPPAAFPGAIGVFAGCGMQAYMMYNLLPNRKLMDSTGLFLVRHTGNDKDFLVTRVSYCLDLKGPAINVQTACSTSLVAVHLACQSLLSGECDMALAGGVTIELPHRQGYQYKDGEILSPDGHCRSFDAESRGTVFGSGAGVVTLRRLADALADGDHIHAVIRGSAINNDGAGKVGYLAPSVDGQAAAIAEAIAVADIGADSIGYIEAHGTATPVGDPIEITALTQAFRASTDKTGYCAVGSVKSNIGHLDTAAGVAGLIKAVESLKHRQIPPTLHYAAPNPSIDFASSPFFVNGSLREWTTSGAPRRAGISSLGVGGTNAHVVVEEAPAPRPSGPSRPWQLLLLSAKNAESLSAATANLADYLVEHPEVSLPDAAYTLEAGRTAMRDRRAVVCSTVPDAVAALESPEPGRVVTHTAETDRTVAFMFAGGGAQYPGMGADLYRDEPVYRAAVDECLTLLRPSIPADLRSLLYPSESAREAAAAQLERPSIALPLLFVTQYALAKLWMSWGIRPSAMIGHSMGEYTAAHLAGVFSLRDALALVALRGRLFERVPEGGMLSVPLPADELRPLLGTELSIAAENAPGLSVASGPLHALEALERTLAEREIDCRRVRISIAAHSSMLDPILEEFGAFFRTVRMAPPTVPFVSNLSGTWITAAEATDASYWVKHLRQTVRFAEGVRVLLEDRSRVLLEVGPGRILATLAKQQPDRSAAQPVLSSMRHPDDTMSDVAFVLNVLGELWTTGVEPDWPAFWTGQTRQRIPLPTYPFQRQRHWIDAVPAALAPVSQPGEAERKADIGQWFYQPSWSRAASPVSAGASTSGSHHTLVFRDEAGIGTTVAERLRAAGHRVTEVLAGSAFEQRSSGEFVVSPGCQEDFERLVQNLVAEGRTPRDAVYLWTAREGRSDLHSADGMVDAEDRAFFGLLAFAQALGREEVSTAIRLTVVSNGMQRVGDEESLSPDRAMLLGPVHVIPREYPNISCRSIDVVSPQQAGWRERRLIDQLVAEITSPAQETVVAFRGGDRLVQRVEPIALPEAASRVREGGVYLITGGLGGMGLVLADHLARSARARLVLTGRSAFPARDAWPEWLRTHPTSDRTAGIIRQLMAIEASGGRVLVMQADVTDRNQMRDVVSRARAEFGEINGVLHAAGAIDDGLMQLKVREGISRVLAPKVRGTLVLDEALRGEPLDFFVVFSSISSMAGIPGQVDYAAANAFLDAFAHERMAREGSLTLAIGWSSWQEVGMAAALAAGADAPSTKRGMGAAHPLLDRTVIDSAEEALFAAELGVGSHWLLGEHRLRGGHCLIPGTGYLEIARAAVTAGNGAGPVEIRDVAFMSPFVLEDDERRELRVHVARTGDRSRFVIAGRAMTEDGPAWQEHVTGMAQSLESQPRHVDLQAIRDRCGHRSEFFSGSEDNPHLDFGPRWRNLSRVDYGVKEALAAVELPESFAADLDDYKLHPAMLDMATACAQSLVPGLDPAVDFFVPMSYTKLRIFGPLPRRVYSHVRLAETDLDPREIAVFDVTLLDEHGVELVDIEEFMMTRIADHDQLDGSRRASAGRRTAVQLDDPPAVVSKASGLEDAIRPAEGVAAFERALSSGLPQVFVAWRDIDSLMSSLREPAAPSTPQKSPPVAVGEIEAVLSAHPAVAQGVVTARPDRTGLTRLVAYVVYDADVQATVSELRRYLKARLPDSLVPAAFIGVETMPLTAEGAVDRQALPDPFGGGEDYVPPATEMQRTIAEVWSEVLGVERVSLHDNFFDIGGHSLLAVRVVTKLDKKIGVRLNQAIMVLQTLEQIAAECEKRIGPRSDAPTVAAPASSIGRKLFNSIRQTVMQS